MMNKMLLPWMCMLLLACGPPIDDQDFDAVLLRAEQGDALAQYQLGRLYDLSGSGPEDDAASFMWYSMAAEQGVPEAQHRLGLMYEFGLGVTKDEVEAAQWYYVAAELGLPQAQYETGRMYYLGLGGFTANHVKAAEFFQMAAEQGNAKSQHMLGEMYYAGSGVQQSYYHSYVWLSLSVTNGGAGSSVRDSSAKALTPDDLEEAEDYAERLRKEINARKAVQG
jgi:TPR repeat protein